jgi:arylsulfatase A-like enzyme
VGQILETLEASPYSDNTIVILSSDHGYHIGEKDCLQKWHLWNESTRVPLMIRIPGTQSGGQTCAHPVSLVDLYPTLTDLCGLPPEPHLPEGGPTLDGFSLKPFLEDPSSNTWEGPPVCLTAIRGPHTGTIQDTEEDPHFSVISERYRYTFCNNGEEELYDHRLDPNEWNNLADDPGSREQARLLREELRKILEKSGYRPSDPETVTPWK